MAVDHITKKLNYDILTLYVFDYNFCLVTNYMFITIYLN